MTGTIYSLWVGLWLVASGAGAQSRDLDVTASDGARLTATYSSPGEPGPGMILLHQCDMNRQAWTSLTGALTERGIHVIALDYRGYGDNRAVPMEYPKLTGDIDAALAALVAQPGVDKNRLAAGGASCGVDHAVQLARRSGQIKALALLSGPTSGPGMQDLQGSGLPVFLAFSANEGGPLPAMKAGVAALEESVDDDSRIRTRRARRADVHRRADAPSRAGRLGRESVALTRDAGLPILIPSQLVRGLRVGTGSTAFTLMLWLATGRAPAANLQPPFHEHRARGGAGHDDRIRRPRDQHLSGRNHGHRRRDDRLRRRRLGRSVLRQRVDPRRVPARSGADQSSLSQSRKPHVRGRDREGGPRPRAGGARAPASATTTTTGTTTCS